MAHPIDIAEHEKSLPLRLIRWLLMLWLVGLVLGITAYTTTPASPIKYMYTGWAAGACGILLAWHAWRGQWLNTGGIVPLAFLWITVHMISGWFFDPLADWAINKGQVQAIGLDGWAQIPVMPLDHAPETRMWQRMQALYALAPWLSGWVILCAVTQALRNPKHQQQFFSVLLLMMMAANAYAFVQWTGWDPFPWAIKDTLEYKNLPSTFGNPNFAGHALVLCIPIAIYMITQRHYWALLPLLTMGWHLYMTGMRAGVLALLAMLGVLLLVQIVKFFPWTPQRKALVLVLIVGAGVLVGLFVGIELVTHNEAVHDRLDSSLLLRLNSYANAASMMMDSPILGVGPDRFGDIAPQHWRPFETSWFWLKGKWNQHVHNDLLELGAESGIVGLLCFVAMLCAVLLLTGRAYFQYRKEYELKKAALALMVLATLLGGLVDACFGFPLRVPVSGAIFFILIGLSTTLYTPVAIRVGNGRIMGILVLLIGLGAGTMTTQNFLADRAQQQGNGALQFLAENPTSQQAYMTATTAYNDVTYHRPWDAEAWLGLAKAQRAAGKHAEAFAHAQQATALAPNHPRAWEVLFRTVNAGWDNGYTASRDWLIQSLASPSNEPDAFRPLLWNIELSHLSHLYLSQFALKMARSTEGEQKTEWLLIADKHSTAPISSPIESIYRSGQMLRAELALEIAADPDALEYKRTQWEDYSPEASAWNDALGIVKEAPDQLAAWEILDGLLIETYLNKHGDYEQALLAGLKHESVAGDPALTAALLTRLARHSTQSQQHEGLALHLAESGIDKFPASTLLWGTALAAQSPLARTPWIDAMLTRYSDVDTLPPLIRVYSELEQDVPDYDTRKKLILGDLLLEASAWEEAKALLTEAYTALPEAEQWWPAMSLARTYRGLENAEKALEWATKAKDLNGGNPLVRLIYAQELIAAKRYALANYEVDSLLRTIRQNSPYFSLVQQLQRILATQAIPDKETP